VGTVVELLPMSIRKDLIDKYDTPQRRQAIIMRDGGRCVMGTELAQDIHEIIGRSAWASTDRDIELCFSPKNSVCLCRKHHDYLQGLPQYKRILLTMLRDKYGYEYSEREFVQYLED